MLDIATRRAGAQGITNFETTVCSADDLPFDDAAFDSISVRFGYMFFPDVARRPPSSRGCPVRDRAGWSTWRSGTSASNS